MKKQFVYLLLLVLLFAACEKDIDLDLSGNKKLVLLSTFRPDQPIRLSLSTSIPVASADSFTAHYPEDAQLQLFENDQYLGDFRFDPGSSITFTPSYVFNHPIQSGANYTVKAQYADYPDVEASTTLLTAPLIEKVERVQMIEIPDYAYPTFCTYLAEVDLTLAAGLPTDSYFHLQAWQEVISYDVIENDTFRYPINIDLALFLPRIEDLALTLEKGNLLSHGLWMSNGPDLRVSFEFSFNKATELKGPIHFELRRVTKDYYLFYKSLEEQDFANFRQSVLFDEPILIHHNIEGGLGHFSAYNSIVKSWFW